MRPVIAASLFLLRGLILRRSRSVPHFGNENPLPAPPGDSQPEGAQVRLGKRIRLRFSST